MGKVIRCILDVVGLMRVTHQPFKLCNLLGTSVKVEKGRASGWMVVVMYLSPWRRSAALARSQKGKLIIRAVSKLTGIAEKTIQSRMRMWNSCAYADGCKGPCLAITSGHLKYPELHLFEFAKTVLLATDRKRFVDRLNFEIEKSHRRAIRAGFKFAVRLNGGSDLNFIDIIESHPDVQFFDYTKDPTMMMRFLRGELPRNYHLTFSRGSSNWSLCARILRMGGNVALVLRNSQNSKIGKRIRIQHGTSILYPGYFYSHVISGDIDDNRFLDDVDFKTKRGKIVELTGKGQPIMNDASGFAMDSYDDIKTQINEMIASVGCGVSQ